MSKRGVRKIRRVSKRGGQRMRKRMSKRIKRSVRRTRSLRKGSKKNGRRMIRRILRGGTKTGDKCIPSRPAPKHFKCVRNLSAGMYDHKYILAAAEKKATDKGKGEDLYVNIGDNADNHRRELKDSAVSEETHNSPSVYDVATQETPVKYDIDKTFLKNKSLWINDSTSSYFKPDDIAYKELVKEGYEPPFSNLRHTSSFRKAINSFSSNSNSRKLPMGKGSVGADAVPWPAIYYENILRMAGVVKDSFKDEDDNVQEMWDDCRTHEEECKKDLLQILREYHIISKDGKPLENKKDDYYKILREDSKKVDANGLSTSEINNYWDILRVLDLKHDDTK